MTPHPLTGKRIVITRPPNKAESFAARLRELGAEPVLLPTIAIHPPSDPAPLDHALSTLGQYDWVLLTSANTVEQLWRRFEHLGIDAAQLTWPPVAVIGSATGAALEQRGITPALMPEVHVAEALVEALAATGDLTGARILLPQGDRARAVLAEGLRDAGAQVDTIVAYENVRSVVDSALLSNPVDVITFTSSSTVENFVEMFEDPLAVLGNALVVCIGPVTADRAQVLGLPVHITAEPHTVDGMIAALGRFFERASAR